MKHILLCTALILPLVMMMTGCDLPIGATSQSEVDPHAGHAHAKTFVSTPASVTAERDPNRLWCGEHDVYEDECVLCHPELDDHAGHDHGHGHVEGPDGVMWCGEHNVAEMECGICQPALLMELDTGQGMKVRLPSGLSIDKAGIRTGQPASSSAEEGGRVLGEVTFNRNELVLITPLAGGVLAEILADVGDKVETGQLLAMIRTPALAEEKSAYVKALADLELARRVHAREKDLVAREIAARQDEETARANLAAAQGEAARARQVLIGLGLGEKEIDTLMSGADTGLPVRAPFPGTVVEREAVPGASVSPGSPLFQIANLDALWMTLSIPESRLGSVREGMPVRARFNAYPGLAFEGELSWIAARVDPRTRMIEARAVLANPQGLLKAGMFGEAELGGLEQRAGVAIPRDAVQDVDGLKIVFARLEPDLYEARLVEPGVSENGMTAIRGGLEPSDEIVLAGSHILKSEFLKARLGAGCADH